MFKQQLCRVILFGSRMLGVDGIIPDKWYLQMLYRRVFNKKLDLKNPKTFNEKLQWMKLYDRRPIYTTMVDKYAVKKYVADIIGEEYIIPTLAVWNKPEEIEWDSLPDQFVLKCTHDSGGLVICRDKSKLDKEAAMETLRKSLKRNYYKAGREWPYKNVPRRIIAEKYMEVKPQVKDLPDYKWYCFNGEPTYCQVIQDRSTIETIDFFDTEWKHQEFVGLNPAAGPAAGPAAVEPARPANLETQIKLARELSKNMPFSRIDLYCIDDKSWFGEITLYPTSGTSGTFTPDKYNEILGDMIKLPGEPMGGVICVKLNDGTFRYNAPDLPDYKFFCFDGVVKSMFVGTERGTGDVKFDYFDADFNHLDLIQEHPMSGRDLPKPQHFEEMKQLASKLSQGYPELRVDFYNINGAIYFGELTLFHHGGVIPFHPEKWDYEFGSWIKLPVLETKHSKSNV